MNKSIFGLILVVVTAIVVVLAIYLTPLKHLNIVQPSMTEVDPALLYKEISANPNGYLFIDVRTPAEYAVSHPKGAINIPIASFSSAAGRAQLPKTGKQIVLTCTNGNLATIAYGYLQNYGYLNLLHLTGGLQQWTLEGLPIEGASVSQVAQ